MMRKDGQGELTNQSAPARRALNIECLLNILSYELEYGSYVFGISPKSKH
ncbi:MAG: hypothetical protein JSV68_08250 [Anaerolineaceae bacterium]|nr:MAG: hypothetical protein JSV68_08250 [Anaerolineaceae bacterium]